MHKKIVVCVCECVCECVWLTQLNYKKFNDENVLLSWITYSNVFFFCGSKQSVSLRLEKVS